MAHKFPCRPSGFRYVISSVSSGDVSCGDLVPEIGITGTPVIDTATGTMYLVAKTKQYDTVTHTTSFYQTLHALDIKTGLDKVTPVQISATYPGNGTGSVGGILTFDPLVEAQRSALLLLQRTGIHRLGLALRSWRLSRLHHVVQRIDAWSVAAFMWTRPMVTRAVSGAEAPVHRLIPGDRSMYRPAMAASMEAPDFGDSVLRLIWPTLGRGYWS